MKTPSAFVLLFIVFFVEESNAKLLFEKRPQSEWQSVFDLTSKFTSPYLAKLDEKSTSGIPYFSYYTDPDQIAAGKLNSPQTSRLHYLIIKNRELIGSVQVSADLSKIQGFQENAGETAKFWTALQLAKKLKSTKTRDYFVRQIGCSPLLSSGLWLHSN